MKKIYILMLIVFFGLALTGFSSEKTIINVINGDDGSIIFYYSDGSYDKFDSSIAPKGPAGETGAVGISGQDGQKGETGIPGEQGISGVSGEKGETGDTGAAGKDGKYVEYRYYAGKIWYRFTGESQWKVLENSNTLPFKTVTIEECESSLYLVEEDLCVDIEGGKVLVNGSEVEYSISGDTVMFNYNKKSYDISFSDTITSISYVHAGYKEQPITVVENIDPSAYYGKYTVTVDGNDPYVVEFKEDGTFAASLPESYFDDSIYTSVFKDVKYFVNGSNIVAKKQYYNPQGSVTYAMDYFLVFDTVNYTFSLTIGRNTNQTTLTSVSADKWINDLSPLKGTWRLYNESGVVVDKLTVRDESFYTYNGITKAYSFNIDTASFTCDGVVYDVKIVNGSLEVVSPSGLSIEVASDAKEISSFYGDYHISYTRVDGDNCVVSFRVSEDGYVNEITLNGETESLVPCGTFEFLNNILTFSHGSDEYKLCFINNIMHCINYDVEVSFEALIAVFDITKLYGDYILDNGHKLQITEIHATEGKVRYALVTNLARWRSVVFVQEDNAIIFTFTNGDKYRVYLDGTTAKAEKDVNGAWIECTLTETVFEN